MDYNELYDRVRKLAVQSWDDLAHQTILTHLARIKPIIEANFERDTALEELKVWRDKSGELARDKANIEINLDESVREIYVLEGQVAALKNQIRDLKEEKQLVKEEDTDEV